MTLYGRSFFVKKIKDKLDENEKRIQKSMSEIEELWEDTGLDPKDSSYLIEKTMRFEMAQEKITEAFALFKEIIRDYKNLCVELEKSES